MRNHHGTLTMLQYLMKGAWNLTMFHETIAEHQQNLAEPLQNLQKSHEITAKPLQKVRKTS